MSTQPNEVLHALLDTFAPGLSWLVRLLSEVLGANALYHVLPVLLLPIISTFILPWILGSLEPFFSLIISSAEIKHRNNLYPQVTRWMSEVKFYSLSGSTIVGITEAFGFWNSNLTPEFVETDDAAYRGKLIKLWTTPGQSHFQFFLFKGRWFALYRDPPRNPPDTFSRYSENILIYYTFWNKRYFEDLMETIQKFNVDSRRGKLQVFSAYQEKRDVSWRQMCKEGTRSQKSMAMDEDMKQDIIEDIRNFLSPECVAFYEERGIAHRRGYLFYGKPGTGKSSFCRVIATEFDLPIYTINLAIVDNHSLQELFRTLPDPPQRCLVVLEDIDTAGIQRTRNTTNENEIDGKERVTLVTVLNVMDGLGAHCGHIFIATTNAKPELDPALTRRGRIDKQCEFLYPDRKTIQNYFAFFFQNDSSDKNPSNKQLGEKAVEFSKAVSHRSVSPATLQEYFLQCNGDPDAAIRNAHTLVASH